MRTFTPADHHRGRAVRLVGVMLIALLWPGTFVQAGPVAINEVIQIIGNHQNAPELRLRALSQTGSTAISTMRPAVDGSTNKQASNAKPVATDSLFPGADFQTEQKPTTVVVITQGDIEGTICDCGDILIAGGGFPKWPLLFLAAIPFFFIDRDSSVSIFVPIVSPTTPIPEATPSIPAAIPEPASLILFGSGLLALGAGFRRRRAKVKVRAAAQRTEDT